jgi:hypothetical protein
MLHLNMTPETISKLTLRQLWMLAAKETEVKKWIEAKGEGSIQFVRFKRQQMQEERNKMIRRLCRGGWNAPLELERRAR